MGQCQMAWSGVTEEVQSDRKVSSRHVIRHISDLKLVKIPCTFQVYHTYYLHIIYVCIYRVYLKCLDSIFALMGCYAAYVGS